MTTGPRRFLKTILWTSVIVAVLLLGVRLLVPAGRLGTMIAERIEHATGGSATFAGAQVDVWPRLRLVLKDGAVVGTGEALRARAGVVTDLESYTACFARLEVSLAWGPLLKKRVEVGEIRLVAPRIEVETRVPQPGAATVPGSGASAATTSAPVALFVAGLAIKDGDMTWSESATGRRIRVEGWDQDVSIGDATLLMDRLAAFSGRRLAPAAAAPASSLELRAHVASLSLEGFHEAGAQRLRDLDLTATLEVPAAADALQLKMRHLTWGGLTVTATGSVAHDLLGDRLRGEWHLTSLDLEALRDALPDALPQLDEAQAAWLADAPLSAAETSARGAFDLPWPLPQGARYRDLAVGLSASAAVRDLETVPPRQSSPWRLSGDLELDGTAAEFRDLSLRVGEGHLDGAATIADLDRERALCTFTLIGQALPASAMLDAVVPSAAPYVDGSADLEMAGRLALGEPEQMRDSLALAGDVLLSEGVVHAESWLESITPYLGSRQDLKEIRYRHLAHTLRVDDGRVFLEDLLVDGYDTDWRGGGWLGLDGGIDMRLDVKLPEGYRPDLGNLSLLAETLRGEDGRIELGMTLKGRAARPTVNLDLAPAKQSAQERIDEGIKGFLDKLRGNE